jgi:DivIVA domain-containing protein
MDAVSTTFPKARRSSQGYDIAQVEDFLEDARRAYSATPGTPAVLSSRGIRSTAFALQKGGYATASVDAALERLEDAFAARERDIAIAAQGERAWYERVRGEAQEILDRVAGHGGARFDRVSSFTLGYDRKGVDAFCERLVDYFQNGRALPIDAVRTVTFRSVRGGYREVQVDAVLDAAIDVMLAVR